MRTCLYCQQRSVTDATECPGCGMPLPAPEALAQQRRTWRFAWFVVALAVFCAVMIVWLPRTIV